jgi:hypothetical protein
LRRSIRGLGGQRGGRTVQGLAAVLSFEPSGWFKPLQT